MDKISPAQRSANMSRVRSKDTKPELLVRRILHSAGYRFRLHRRDLPGSPDIVLPKWKTAIFVHGCFWHGHEGCRRSKLPATRTEFWKVKIERNRERDRIAREELAALGYQVVTLWECELRNPGSILNSVSGATGRGDLVGLSKELEAVLGRITSGHDVVPFMALMMPTKDVVFRPLPPEMLEILRASPDYASVRPGKQPTWFQIASGADAIELVVYRAETDGVHYVLAPREKN